MKTHNESMDQWSFECNPVTGALTCSAALTGPSGDSMAAAGHFNRLPSSLTDESTSPDPPIEAHLEPKDRASSIALTDVPDGLSAAPTNHKEALRRPDWNLWKAACMLEMQDLIASGTIVLGMPPSDAKIVQSIIQYRLKMNDDGLPDKRKARFCARGDTYSAGPDVPIFAPTAPWVTVRCLLSVACANNWVVKTFDVKSVFTSVERTGLPDIWLAAPFTLGYPTGHAFHLEKNLYGFQHSPRAFYDAFSQFLTSELGFERCAYDKTLFYRTTPQGLTYISLYVDDALVVCANEEA